ncbi:MAG: GTPase [Cyanobacteria bacterium CRU_2_1]|nr:GTPase [Cyanobacteria bacterium RU_5_0]NJR57866.1 GTPase [Cyanobacteria bacterium CRU_2_1]
MEPVRLVITGTPGVGKTTFVQTVSDIGIINTDRTATDATATMKSKTTVVFDFGRVSFGSGMELHVYGTPGQDRFNFMWDILIRRADAYMLLVAAHRLSDIPKANQILAFMNERVKIPVVIGITHLDCFDARSPEEIMIRLGYRDQKNCPPVVAVDANSKSSVNRALNVLLLALLVSRNQQPPETVIPNKSVAYADPKASRSKVGITFP